MLQLELQVHAGPPATVSAGAQLLLDSASTFDVRRHISLVPVFCEFEVKSHFSAFDRIAVALHWQKDVWDILLQCKLASKTCWYPEMKSFIVPVPVPEFPILHI